MNIRTPVLISIVSAWAALGGSEARADAWFTPSSWKQHVPLTEQYGGQAKHRKWIRDTDHNYIDDRADTLAATTPGGWMDVLIELNQPVPRDSIVSRFGSFGEIRYIGKVLTMFLMGVPDSLLDDLAASPLVAMVESQPDISPAVTTSTRAIQARPSTHPPRAYPRSAAEHNPPRTGAGVRVAFLDTGIMKGNPTTPAKVAGFDAVAYDDRLGSTKGGPDGIDDSCEGTPFGDGDCTGPEDEPGDGTKDPCKSGTCTPHGTRVAGVAVGRGIPKDPKESPPSEKCAGLNTVLDENGIEFNCVGTAKDADVVDIRVCESDARCTWSDVMEGLEWLAMNANRHRIKVANMSWTVCADDDPTGAINALVDYIAKSGTVMVAGHGNRNRCTPEMPCYPPDKLRRSEPPGSAAFALTVSGSDDVNTIWRKDDKAYGYGLHGPTCQFVPGAPPNIAFLKPDVSAPSEGVWAPVTNGLLPYWFSPSGGTSIAAAHASGAAAILLQAYPNLRPVDVAARLRATADKPYAFTAFVNSPYRWSQEFGTGIIDVDSALIRSTMDVAFAGCGGDPGTVGLPCRLTASRESWENEADIKTETSPVAGVRNRIIATVLNRGSADADDVTVQFGVYALNVGASAFDDIGRVTIPKIRRGATGKAVVDWTPTDDAEQCIQASIEYGPEAVYWNNVTQRNVTVDPASSMESAPISGTGGSAPTIGVTKEIVVENPFREAATFRVVILPGKKGTRPTVEPDRFENDPAVGLPAKVQARLMVPAGQKDADGRIAIYGASKRSPADERLIGGVTIRTFVPPTCTVRAIVVDERSHGLVGVSVRYGRAAVAAGITWEGAALTATTGADGSINANVEEGVPYRFRYARSGEPEREMIVTPKCGERIRLTYGAP